MEINNNAEIFRKVLQKYQRELQKAPAEVAIIAFNFFLKGFSKGGKQVNGTIDKWKERKFETDRSLRKRQVLTKTGKLSDSLKQKHGAGVVEIYTNSPYAAIHQTGGKITITPKMRKFFWAMYYKELGKIKTTNKGTQNIRQGQKINKVAMIWRNLAMHKGNTLTIPKREIFYDSKDLAKQIDRYFTNQINKIT